jgi:hypothetical protein
MARICRDDLREAKYFCKGGWTALSTKRPTGKSPQGGKCTPNALTRDAKRPFRIMIRMGKSQPEVGDEFWTFKLRL